MLHLACLNAKAGQPQTIFFTAVTNQDCNTNIQLIAVASSGLPITFTFVQGKGKFINNSILLPSRPGKYIIQASQSGDATFDSATSVTREFLVISSKQEEAAGISLKVLSPLCIGDAVDFSVTTITGLSYTWILDDGSTSTGVNYHINTLTSSLNCSGIISIKEGNCELLSLSMNLTANAKTNISITAPDSVISGDTILLQGAPKSGTFTGNGVQDTLFFAPHILQKTSEIITYSYKNIFGCVSETLRTVEIYPKPALEGIRPKIYEYITPDGDNKNDVFQVENIQNFQANELVVFNSWGNELYRKKDYNNEWSPNLSKGIYYYDFKVTAEGKHYTGHFYVSP